LGNKQLSPGEIQRIWELFEDDVKSLRALLQKGLETESHEEIAEKGLTVSITASEDDGNNTSFMVWTQGPQTAKIASWFLARVGRQPLSGKVQ
jgi:hypothetical protein